MQKNIKNINVKTIENQADRKIHRNDKLVVAICSILLALTYFSNVKPVNDKTKIDIIASQAEKELQSLNTIDDIKNKYKDDEAGSLGFAMGYFNAPSQLKQFCESTGYIPQGYINKVNELKGDLNLDEDMKNLLISNGATKEQALYAIKKMYEVWNRQQIKSFEADF